MNDQELYYTAIKEHLAPQERLYRNVVRRADPPRRIVRRALTVAAACFVLALAAVACIPSARAAVLAWLKPAADPRTYLSTPAAEREAVPALEAAIEPAAGQQLAVTVTDAADASWQAWAERLSVEFDEILYDGSSVYVTGTLHGNAADIVKPIETYTQTEDAQGVTLSPPDDMVTCCAFYALAGNPLRSTGSGILAQPSFAGTDADSGSGADAVPIAMDFPVGTGLTGVQELTVELSFTDMQTFRDAGEFADGRELSRVRLHIAGLTFDATAGTSANAALPGTASAALTGEVLVLALEHPENGVAQAGNDRLSLEGGSLSLLQMQQRLTGSAMTFALRLPEGWSKTQCQFFSDRFSLELIIDGENQGGFGDAYTSIQYYDRTELVAGLGIENPADVTDPHNIVFTIETGLQPEDWQRIQRFSALLCVNELTTYNSTALPENSRVSVPFESDGWSEDTETKRLSDCPLTIR